MKLFLISIVLAIFCCDVCFAYLCRYYDENTKSLLIYCGHGAERQQQQSPENCTHEIPSLNTLGVVHLKVEGCYESDPDGMDIESSDFFDISYSGLRAVDWSIDASESIVDFDTSFNELIEVPKAILRKYPKLEMLNLSYNSLTKIYNGDFKNGQKLQAINLSHNMLQSIESNAFANLRELHFIDLRDNDFVTIPVLNDLHTSTIDIQENSELTTFDCLSISTQHKRPLFVRISWEYIKSFYGDSNCQQWKFNVKQKNQLQGVYLRRPPFRQIDLVCNNRSFHNVQYFVAGREHFYNVSEMLALLGPSVWKIDVSGNFVGLLNSMAFKRFRFLRELSLSDTGLTTIDINTLMNLKLLNRLDLSMNHFIHGVNNSILLQYFGHLIDFNVAGDRIKSTELREMVQYLPSSVQRLNLSKNNLSLVVNAFNRFERLNDLKYLNLSDTSLSNLYTIPIESLRQYDVSNNDLSNVDFASVLSAVNRLTEFRAANSKITNASAILANLGSSVQVLDLSGNIVALTFDLRSIQALRNLQYLNLSGTHLKAFDLDSLIPLKELHTLDLSHNQLEYLNLKTLSNLTQLEHLYLNDNELTKLDIFNWPTSPKIAISKNNMPCSYLRQLNNEHPKARFIGDPLDQKHGADCRSSTQGISDFLGTVYNAVKFW